MKKLLVMILLCMVLLTGCDNITDLQESNMFVYIQAGDHTGCCYDIVYHRDTKVMYVVSHGPYNCGNFTLLVNPDGTPMLYEAESEE